MTKPRRRKASFLWIAITLAVFLGGGYALWSFSFSDNSPKPKTIPPELLANAKRRTIENRLQLTGEIAPVFSVDIKSEISGKVETIHVHTGQKVAKGDPLITIDDSDLLTEKLSAQTEIDGARIEVEKRKGNYERAKALFNEKLISKEVFANLDADLKIAENSLLKANSKIRTVEDKLSKTRILAPANGTVLNLNVNEGQVVVGATSVNSGIILMNFADLDRLMIQTHVNQMDINKIQEGCELAISMPGPKEESARAKVEFIAPVATVKNNIKGFAVQAMIENHDPRLRPGMSINMQLSLGRSTKTISVPISAVFREDDGQSFVYVRQNGIPERRPVTTGISNLSFTEITHGLTEGEEILLIQPKDLDNKS